MLRFKDRVIAITGGTSGIGRAAAFSFAKEGAKVSVCGRDLKKGAETSNDIKKAGGDCLFIQCDVSKIDDVANFISKTVDHFGRLDYAFNNAGVSSSRKTILERTEKEWDYSIDINLKGLWLCMKFEIEYMIKNGGGSIINTSSGWGISVTNLVEDYCAGKHGAIGLTKALALDFAKYKIRINAICPGLIKTPINEERYFSGPDSEKIIKKMIPLQREGSTEEVAQVVMFLCSEASSYITGCIIPIDGGALAGIQR